MAFPKQKQFHPQNPKKYTGSLPIVSRSSWEEKAFSWFDRDPRILTWGSESFVVDYVDPVDQRHHRYFVDLNFTAKDGEGKILRHFVEIKPACQTKPPVRGKKREQTFLTEAKTYLKNMAKWDAAKKAAEKRGGKFWIWTEEGLTQI